LVSSLSELTRSEGGSGLYYYRFRQYDPETGSEIGDVDGEETGEGQVADPQISVLPMASEADAA